MRVAMNPGRAFRAPLTVSLGVALLPWLGSCGARSEVGRQPYGDPLDGSAIKGCLGDLDCGEPDLCAPNRCVAGTCMALPRVSCDDGDACTSDHCIPKTGLCENTPLTLDEDGDGHRGPLPGFLPGSPGSCGDDCDDTSAAAFPGGKEVCDGVDNDCNGIVDDGARYAASSSGPLLISTGADQAGLGGLAFGGNSFGVTFSAMTNSTTNDFSAFDPLGSIVVPPTAITHENTDAYTGPLAWTGKVFGAVWEDRRDQDFEIYFNRLDSRGQKLASDVRVTDAPNFSLRPDVVWSGSEFVVVWADLRGGESDSRIFGQRIDADGRLVASNVPLTPDGSDADAPHLAKGATELGVVFNETGSHGRQLAFRTVSTDLGRLGKEVVLGGGGAASSAIVWSGDRYVIVWDTAERTPGPSIHGAAVAPDGTVLVAERDVTALAPFARSQALLPLGDRLLLVWAQEDGGAYTLYTKMLSVDLSDLSAPERITNGVSNSLNPAVAIGPSGTVAVAYEDADFFEVYATRLQCVAGK